MRLSKARVTNYRSIKDSGWFDVEEGKTILVGPNEAGKTALLRALEHLRPGPVVRPLQALRDFPRSEYHRISSGELDPKNVIVAEAEFTLDDEDRFVLADITDEYAEAIYKRWVYLDNRRIHAIEGGPNIPTVRTTKDDFRRLAVHADSRVTPPAEGAPPAPRPSEELAAILTEPDPTYIAGDFAQRLSGWIETHASPYVDGSDEEQSARLERLRRAVELSDEKHAVLAILDKRMPTMVYYSNYTRVQPAFHLDHLAGRIDRGEIDEADAYNFGNFCLLKLLNFSARELSNLGRAADPAAGDDAGFENYRNQLDERSTRLNAASLRLTRQVGEIWQPAQGEGKSDYTIRVVADQQYLKVVVEDSLGVEIELDQRSEGFQWLVSFFIVFFAQTSGDLSNAILLLDEPGLSLHGLKQREFRSTLSSLAEGNQLLFTTHSPFLVGPDELDVVRVIEMIDRDKGTKVHGEVVADDPASLLPLQEALGYGLAESLFAQQRNLILEGLTDYWYVEATADLLRGAGIADLTSTIALVPASGAGKVVYFATILHAHELKVAALLDSDAAGDQVAQQDTLVHALGNKAILRTKDSYSGKVTRPEIEDTLRDTLVLIGKDALGWDVAAEAASHDTRPIMEVFSEKIGSDFSKYKLAKAYVRWTRDHAAADLTDAERAQWEALIEKINRALK